MVVESDKPTLACGGGKPKGVAAPDHQSMTTSRPRRELVHGSRKRAGRDGAVD